MTDNRPQNSIFLNSDRKRTKNLKWIMEISLALMNESPIHFFHSNLKEIQKLFCICICFNSHLNIYYCYCIVKQNSLLALVCVYEQNRLKRSKYIYKHHNIIKNSIIWDSQIKIKNRICWHDIRILIFINILMANVTFYT